MKHLLKITLIAAAVSFATTAFAAHEPAGETKTPDKKSEQSSAIKAILDDTHAKTEAVMHDKSLSREQKQVKAKDLRAKSREKILAILPPERRAKWLEEEKERDAKREERRDERHETKTK